MCKRFHVSAEPPLLEVVDLKVHLATEDGIVKAVDGVSFTVGRGETLGLVGESGCGKSVTCRALLRLHSERVAQVSGRVLWKGRDLLSLSPRSLREIRGKEIAMVFQDPMSSLNPVRAVGAQLTEAVHLHQKVSARQARARARELLGAVGISNPERRLDDYPHQFSGGMRQRVMIAMALVNNPDLLIADEPTTALDVTTQAQILDLMEKLQQEFGSALIVVTHDLGVVAETADEVIVMYAGRILERGSAMQLFKRPCHPYTWGLLGSLPRLDREIGPLLQIPGQPPSLLRPPAGCRFHPRCAYAFDVCAHTEPELTECSHHSRHLRACHLEDEAAAPLAAALQATAEADDL